MKPIVWSDEKLYKISAGDYGGPFHRVLGVLVNCVAKGSAFALIGAFCFLTPRLLNSPRAWRILLPPLAIVCGVWVGFSDRRHYLCEIEIRPDRIVRHAGGQTSAVERAGLRAITEGGNWTLFGWVNGLAVRDKKITIFIPRDCAEYPEIKSRLNSWGPIAR